MDLLSKLKQNYASAHPIEVAQTLEVLPGKPLSEQLSVFKTDTAAAVARSMRCNTACKLSAIWPIIFFGVGRHCHILRC